MDKQHDKDSTFGGQKRGASIRIRKPNQYVVRTGWNIDVQDQAEQSVTLTIGRARGVDMHFSDHDLALEINEFSRRFIQPAMKTLASAIDYECFEDAVNATYNLVGTAGTVPQSALVWLEAGAKLSNSVAPVHDRVAIVNPATQAYTVDALKALFHNSNQVSKQYLSGTMGSALGFDWYMSQNVPAMTTGSRDGVGAVNATLATQGVAAMVMKNLTSGTIPVGEIFTVAGVYQVNPQTKKSTGALQQFVVTTAVPDASGTPTVNVAPAIYTTGALQNVSGFPTADDVTTFFGSASTAYAQNLVFHKEAFTYASANLEMPNDVSFKSQMAVDGINIRLLRQYDINSSNYPTRMDVYYGFVAQYPQSACRVSC